MRSNRIPWAKLVPEQLWYVPGPDIVMTGCRPFVPPHATHSSEPCHVCGDKVADRPDLANPTNPRPTVVYCARCDRMAPEREQRLAKQRLETAISAEAEYHAEASDTAFRDCIESSRRTVLSEAERRRIWMGCRWVSGSTDRRGEPTNLAKLGREWLTNIGQQPDWTLILDKRGRVIGRETLAPMAEVANEPVHA